MKLCKNLLELKDSKLCENLKTRPLALFLIKKNKLHHFSVNFLKVTSATKLFFAIN